MKKRLYKKRRKELVRGLVNSVINGNDQSLILVRPSTLAIPKNCLSCKNDALFVLKNAHISELNFPCIDSDSFYDGSLNSITYEFEIRGNVPYEKIIYKDFARGR